MKKTTLVSVVGPTAIGKTKLAIALANHFDAPIISADSRQFYKELCIGTAVPTGKELKSAHHHFIQHKSILDQYSVGDFEREAIFLLEELFKKKKVVIMVGGSGLYVNAVTKGLDKFPEIDPEIRNKLNKEFEEKGIRHLQNQLKLLDSVYHKKVDLENPRRLVRALEVCIGAGKSYSSFIHQEKPKRAFGIFTIGITADRDRIYDRINKRVDIMMKQGLLEEVRSVYKQRELNALQTVGYKELFQYLDGECDLESAISEIKKNTRRFAKRQLTWFRKNKNTFWIDQTYDIDKVIAQIEKKIKPQQK